MLIKTGHRKIAFITGESWMEAADQRLEGYERALRAAGIPIDPNLIVEGNFLPSGGRAATLRLLGGPIRPHAIFCANDLMAVGYYEALKERGERVSPGHITDASGVPGRDATLAFSVPTGRVTSPQKTESLATSGPFPPNEPSR